MKTSTLMIAAGLLALIPVSASARIERTIEKTFNVQPGGLLTVETQGGNVRVETSEASVVKVVAKQTIRADSESEADALLEKLTMTIEQDTRGISAKAKYQKINWGRLPVQVDFVVTVPSRYNVSLRTSGGEIAVGDLDGEVQARTSGGSMTLGSITGKIDAGTSGGNIRLVEGKSDVKLNTSGGNIRVERAVGVTELDTSGGDIEIKSVENAVHAETSGGSVTAGIEGALKGDCVLSTSGGSVRATIDRGVGFALDAVTSGGTVDANGLTITIDQGGLGKSKLSGKVNGGGPLLKLRTSGGNIKVVTR